MAGERRCVLDRFRFRPVCCGFRVYCSNKPTRLSVRRRRSLRRIAGSSRGEERKKNDPPTRRSIFRTMRFGAFFFRPRTSKKRLQKLEHTGMWLPGKRNWDCHLSDNSNEPELRARSDEATTTRCRKQKLRKEKLLRLRQRCTCFAVVVDRSPCTSGIVSHFTVSRASCLCVHGFELRPGKSARSGRACLPSIGKEGADCRSKGIFLPMGDHGILGSLRRAFSPPWRLSTSL